MFLIFDTETTGLPTNWNAPLTDFNNWPRVVQLAWQLHDAQGKLISAKSFIVKPDGFTIPFNAEKIHGVSTERALREGLPLMDVVLAFLEDVNQTTYLAGHNIEFDINVMGCELLRLAMPNYLDEKNHSTRKNWLRIFVQYLEEKAANSNGRHSQNCISNYSAKSLKRHTTRHTTLAPPENVFSN